MAQSKTQSSFGKYQMPLAAQEPDDEYAQVAITEVQDANSTGQVNINVNTAP